MPVADSYAAACLMAKLRTFGVGISRTARLCETDALCPRVRLGRAVRAGQLIAVLPDTALWTVNSFLADGDDACGLAPAPEELAKLVLSHSAAYGDGGEVGPALDEWYIAHCLALRCFTKADCWFSARIRRGCTVMPSDPRGGAEATRTTGMQGIPDDAALLRKMAETMVSVPMPVALAALRYVRAHHLRRCAAECGRHVLCVAPFLDLLVVDAAAECGMNVELRCGTAQEVRGALPSAGLVGARQRLRGKEDVYRYWLLRASRDLPAATTLLLSRNLVAPS